MDAKIIETSKERLANTKYFIDIVFPVCNLYDDCIPLSENADIVLEAILKEGIGSKQFKLIEDEETNISSAKFSQLMSFGDDICHGIEIRYKYDEERNMPIYLSLKYFQVDTETNDILTEKIQLNFLRVGSSNEEFRSAHYVTENTSAKAAVLKMQAKLTILTNEVNIFKRTYDLGLFIHRIGSKWISDHKLTLERSVDVSKISEIPDGLDFV